jgi:predicted small integral membrane protein
MICWAGLTHIGVLFVREALVTCTCSIVGWLSTYYPPRITHAALFRCTSCLEVEAVWETYRSVAGAVRALVGSHTTRGACYYVKTVKTVYIEASRLADALRYIGAAFWRYGKRRARYAC